MTEDEARTKWCPLAREHSGNRFANGISTPGALCIGSACMAWRWDAAEAREGEYPTSPRKVIMTGGHCGAFGSLEPIATWEVGHRG